MRAGKPEAGQESLARISVEVFPRLGIKLENCTFRTRFRAYLN